MSGGIDVGAGREQLAELHEGRPELVEHLAQAAAAIRDRNARPPGRSVPGEIPEPVPAQHVPEPVPRRDLRDLGQAPEVPRPSLARRHAGIVRARPRRLLGPLEKRKAVLELRDSELERLHRLARRDSELGADVRGRITRGVAEALRLAAPTRDDVREGGAQLVPLDADRFASSSASSSPALRGEHEGAETGEGQRLERAAVATRGRP